MAEQGRCVHDLMYGPGFCRFCAIVVEDYYEAMTKRRVAQSPASSANILIAHYQECVRWTASHDPELGTADDLPSVPIVKIEDVSGEQEDKPSHNMSDVAPIIPSQDTAEDHRSWITELRELPPSFAL